MNFISIAAICVGGWAVINGLLHDIFVLRSDHGKIYDRNLLRLLMDGHILITCGIMILISYKGLQNNEQWAYYVAGAACISLLVYCGMIFPFLKSIATILLNAALLVFLIINYLKNF